LFKKSKKAQLAKLCSKLFKRSDEGFFFVINNHPRQVNPFPRQKISTIGLPIS
jgi:hypothetical protein